MQQTSVFYKRTHPYWLAPKPIADPENDKRLPSSDGNLLYYSLLCEAGKNKITCYTHLKRHIDST